MRNPTRSGNPVSVKRRNQVLPFIFIVTAYLRQGAFGGMTRRDWRIFLLSWLIGNAWWSVVCFTGLTAVQWLWAWVRG